MATQTVTNPIFTHLYHATCRCHGVGWHSTGTLGRAWTCSTFSQTYSTCAPGAETPASAIDGNAKNAPATARTAIRETIRTDRVDDTTPPPSSEWRHDCTPSAICLSVRCLHTGQSHLNLQPGFPILGVFRLKGQSKRDGSIIVRSCKASLSPVYPIRDAFLAVNHVSCPSLSSSGPRQWGESALKTSRLPGALSLLAKSWLYPPSAWRRR